SIRIHRHGRVMHHHKAEVRLPALPEVRLQPLPLLVPERGTLFRRLRGIRHVAVDHAEMRRPPIEGIIRLSNAEELPEMRAVPLVVAQRREKDGLSQEVTLDIEEG